MSGRSQQELEQTRISVAKKLSSLYKTWTVQQGIVIGRPTFSITSKRCDRPAGLAPGGRLVLSQPRLGFLTQGNGLKTAYPQNQVEVLRVRNDWARGHTKQKRRRTVQ
jgi:hypothetical protein